MCRLPSGGGGDDGKALALFIPQPASKPVAANLKRKPTRRHHTNNFALLLTAPCPTLPWLALANAHPALNTLLMPALIRATLSDGNENNNNNNNHFVGYQKSAGKRLYFARARAPFYCSPRAFWKASSREQLVVVAQLLVCSWQDDGKHPRQATIQAARMLD